MQRWNPDRTVNLFRAGLAMLGAAAVTAAMAASWNGIGHKVRVKMDGAATKSWWIAGTPAPGYPANALNSCVATPNMGTGWIETSYVVANGSYLKALAFSDKNCTVLRRERGMTVPGVDGLDFVYLALY